MKVLIIGGTGIISSEVCYRGLDCGIDVYILNRGRNKHMIDKRAKLIVADVVNDSIEELNAKLGDNYFDVVVDFLVLEQTRLKKHLAFLKGKCRQYVFISSATAYEKSDENQVITENTPIGNPKWDYAYNKYICEKYLEEHVAEYNMVYTVVRPYVTYGKTRIPFAIIPGGANWTLINRIENGKPVVLWDEGRAICTLTHTKDFAVGMVGLWGNEKAYGEAFHITSDFTQTWKEVLEKIILATGKNAPVVSMTSEYIAKNLPEYEGVLFGDKGTNMVFDNSKMKAAVPEFESKITFEEGIKDTISYFRKTPEIRNITYGWDGRIDWLVAKFVKENGLDRSLIKKCRLSAYNEKLTLKQKIAYITNRYGIVRFIMSKIKKG
mgnify:CR=1 FL=1